MSFKTWKNLPKFRSEFTIPDINLLRWFPGHMAGGIKKMQTKLKVVDCIIEVHDARIPISGRNKNFKRDFLGIKPHVLALNKADLADPRKESDILNYFRVHENLQDVVFTDCKRQKSSEGLNNLIPKVLDAIANSTRYNRMTNREYGVLIIGVPNVGKSSIINALRSKYLQKTGNSPVGAKPGVTLSVQNRVRISYEPPVFIYDTPGILSPHLPNLETGMKLALCATTKDSLVGIFVIADYLLYWCNKHQWNNYLDYFSIKDPCDNIGHLLTQYCIKHRLYQRCKSVDGSSAEMVLKPNIHAAASLFVEAFRNGVLGPITLDSDILS